MKRMEDKKDIEEFKHPFDYTIDERVLIPIMKSALRQVRSELTR
jgi:hypothetical protein